MTFQNKIKNAKESHWLEEGLPKWKIKLIIFWARLKAKSRRRKWGLKIKQRL